MLPEDRQITLQAAAATLAISPSRLRRWADEGRIPSVRTAGGHRRFSLAAVRRMAAESGVRPTVRPVEPPGEPLPVLAETLRAHGRQLAAAAAAAIYREGPPGWFASEAASDHLLDWMTDLGASCETGVYTGALQATASLMTRAHGHAATPAGAPRLPRALRPGVRAHAGAHGRRARGDRRRPPPLRLPAAGLLEARD